MLIKVTQEHISNGMPFRPNCCPLALAFDDAGFNCSVGGTTVWLNGKCYWLPEELYHFRHNFDIGHDVEPFEFELIGWKEFENA